MTWKTKDIPDELSLDDLLKKITQLDLYSYYLNETIEIGKPISSPFREDKHPSFVFFKSKIDNKLMWHDFGTGDSGDIISFVREVFNLTYKAALKKMYDDVIAGKVKYSTAGIAASQDLKEVKTIISIKRKNFTHTDDEYWEQFGIDRDILRHFEVFPISHYWVNNELKPFNYTREQPMYAYKFYNKFKIYRPYSKQRYNKWRTNTNNGDIQGWAQLPPHGDLLIITKSLKDVMTLYKLGYTAIAPNSESATISYDISNKLKEMFKRIIILFDYDDGGLNGASKLSKKHGFEKVFIPYEYKKIYNAKDVSDFYKEFGEKKTKQILKDILK